MTARAHRIVLVVLGTVAIGAGAAAQASARAAPATVCDPVLCQPGGMAGGAPLTPGPPPASGDVVGSAALYASAAHTGYVANPGLVAPLVVRWSRTIRPQLPSPALYGDGRVYAIFDGALRALDPATGNDLWTVPLAGVLGAFDAGRVFVVEGGSIHAFSAATGASLWSRSTPAGEGGFGRGSPVAVNGVVYASSALSGGSATFTEVFALDAATGQLRWQHTGDGFQATPTVAGGRVYTSYRCRVDAWNALNGTLLWKHDSCANGSSATGAGDRPPAHYRGRLYDASAVLDPGSGVAIDSNPGGQRFADGVSIATSQPLFTSGEGVTMRAFDVASKGLLWTHPVPEGRDVNGTAEPLIAGSAVYTVANNRLAASELHSGRQVYSANLRLSGEGVDFASHGAASLAAAPGLLVLSGSRVFAGFESAYQPAAGGVDVATTFTDVPSRRRVRLGGLVGTSLRAGQPKATVQMDVAPFGGKWRTIGQPRANAGGYFELGLRPDRSVRLRASVGGATSKAVIVYANGNYRTRLRLTKRGAKIAFSVSGPRAALSGRRVAIYATRKYGYRRLGSGVMRGRRGHFRGVTRHTIRYDPADQYTLCVVGGPRLGVGRPDKLNRRCGARTIKVAN
jgi:outer membrane protein assembly factor BamB